MLLFIVSFYALLHVLFCCDWLYTIMWFDVTWLLQFLDFVLTQCWITVWSTWINANVTSYICCRCLFSDVFWSQLVTLKEMSVYFIVVFFGQDLYVLNCIYIYITYFNDLLINWTNTHFLSVILQILGDIRCCE